MEQSKEILELLQKIEKSNRTQVRTGRLMCLLGLVGAVCGGIALVLVIQVLPRLEEILPQINTVLEQMKTVLGNLEQTTAQLAAIDLEGMVSNVDALVATGQEGLEQTMDKLNSIDLNTLNKAITDLAKVIEPLANFISRFS